MRKKANTGEKIKPTNCFAYGNQECLALSELICATKKCPFFKTKEQRNAELKKIKERLG